MLLAGTAQAEEVRFDRIDILVNNARIGPGSIRPAEAAEEAGAPVAWASIVTMAITPVIGFAKDEEEETSNRIVWPDRAIHRECPHGPDTVEKGNF